MSVDYLVRSKEKGIRKVQFHLLEKGKWILLKRQNDSDKGCHNTFICRPIRNNTQQTTKSLCPLFITFLNNPFSRVFSRGRCNGRTGNSTGNFIWGVSVNAPGNCAPINLNYQSGIRQEWLPAVGHLGWLGKSGFRLWSIAHLMAGWGSAPLSAPQCQLGQVKGSQHQLGKRSRRVLPQRKGAIPEVVRGTWGGWRPRKGKKRDAQLILQTAMIWGN